MLLLASAFALVVPLQALSEDTKGDASKLIGTWTLTSEETSGTKVSADKIKGRQVKITRDAITCLESDGKTHMACKYEVDTSRTPWKVDMTCTEGEYKDKKLHGIAQFEGDTLKLCFAKPDAETPTRFDSTKEGQCSLNLKRSER
jgi:uncharacterized protein (TIGR03067 family)